MQRARILAPVSDRQRLTILRNRNFLEERDDDVRPHERSGRRRLAARSHTEAGNADKTFDVPVSNVFRPCGHSPRPPPWGTIAATP